MTDETALPETGFIRIRDVLRVIPVSRSTWWAGVQTGRFPAAIKLGPRITAWRVEDIRNLISNAGVTATGS
jgi:predicted DNA-binding transcriptional regulator AlpA